MLRKPLTEEHKANIRKALLGRQKSDHVERFWSNVDKTGECWNWLGVTNSSGYAQFFQLGKPKRLVHRVSYEMLKGEIPDGLQIDHLCKNRRCVNPEHLEAVSAWENNMRSSAPSAFNARKTSCVNGHELVPENTYLSQKHRSCRKCKLARVWSPLLRRRLRREEQGLPITF